VKINNNSPVRPPLKWAGSKYRILSEIIKRLPKGVRFIEPFAGSAAVALNTDYNEYLINDLNKDLINFYTSIQNNVDEFIETSKKLFSDNRNQENAFYLLRDIFNQTTDNVLKASIFLYINKHGYNGLCRYNASGGLNVPFGKYKSPYFPENEIRRFATKLAFAKFTSVDFEKILKKAKSGDVIYCDPPYVPLSNTSNFTAYSAGGFGFKQQERLAELSLQLSQRGIPVIISNHYTSLTKVLYKDARKYKVDVRRLISCDGKNRNIAKEVIAVYPSKS
jgi:DNA adenine methylase